MTIIDTHCHAGRNWFEPIETLEAVMNANGVDGAVLIQLGGTYDNDYLFQAAAARSGRFKVVVLVDPDDADPLGAMTRLSEQGAAGVRLVDLTSMADGDVPGCVLIDWQCGEGSGAWDVMFRIEHAVWAQMRLHGAAAGYFESASHRHPTPCSPKLCSTAP